jgi:ERCC4-related helicase
LHYDYKKLYHVVSSVIAAIKRKGRCTVFYDGRFKVLTQDARIEKENSLLVGIYNKDFITSHLIEDLRCTLSDVKEKDALTDPVV